MEPKMYKPALYALGASVFAGAVAGSFLAMLYPELPLWDSRVFRQGIGLEDMPFWMLTGFSCLSLCIMAALGLSALGAFCPPIVIFCKSAALSAVLAQLYRSSCTAGLLTAVLFIMPFGLGSLLITMLAGREAMQSGWWILRAVIGSSSDAFPLRRYAVWSWAMAALQLGLTAAQYGLIHAGYPAFLRLMTN